MSEREDKLAQAARPSAYYIFLVVACYGPPMDSDAEEESFLRSSVV